MDHKISKRNLFIIVVMMFVVLFLFMSILVIKDRENMYDQNDYYAQRSRTKKENTATAALLTEHPREREYAVYIGSGDNATYNTAYYWCAYRRFDLLRVDEPSDYMALSSVFSDPVMIMIDGKTIDPEDADGLEYLSGLSTPKVYCSIPTAYNIQKSRAIMNAVGIVSVADMRCEVYGIHLYGGFVLGGERVYTAAGADEELMDMETTMVRYRLKDDVKTYMVGAYEETPTDTTLQPPMIWRYFVDEGSSFVFNCDLIEDISGIGYLDACLAQVRDYDIYEVINADVLSLVNFPCMAEEDTEEIIDRYNRSLQGMFRNLIWPSVISVNEESGFTLTSFMSVQYNYFDSHEADVDNYIYYLMQLKEQGAEAGLSFEPVKTVSIPDKMASDDFFLTNSGIDYRYQMMYAGEDSVNEVVSDYMDYERYRDITTILTDSNVKKGLFEYKSDDLLLMRNTADVTKFKYSDDLKLRGYETALLYSSPVIDVAKSIYPETEDMEWQHVEESFAAVVGTFWKNFDYVDKLTLSEADARVREFMAVDYTTEPLDNGVKLYLENFRDKAYFIMRSPGRELKSVTGGEFDEAENGVYLIKALEPQVVITFDSAKEVRIK